MATKRKDKGSNERLTRIAIVTADKCKPKRCQQECKKFCPVVRMGKLCIEVTPKSKIALISEELCIGCGICVKKCPFKAIQIINTPKDLSKETTHRYGPNSFKLHRLPVPRANQVLGLVGTNGIGKSTALRILAGKLKPNLGRFDNAPSYQEIITYFRGSELQNYFVKIFEDNLKAAVKPQYVDNIPNAVKGTVGHLVQQKDERNVKDYLIDILDLGDVLDRKVGLLSGGELQRFAVAIVALQKADVYMFDEPSSYLDVYQRLRAARVVRSLLSPETYVIVVEHDLSVLDYLSDFICVLYGVPGGYGVVTLPFSVREGINIFLEGEIPTENLRFRDDELTFKLIQNIEEKQKPHARYEYHNMTKTFLPKKKKKPAAAAAAEASPSDDKDKPKEKPKEIKGFKLTIEKGNFTDSEIIVMLGRNGTGKTTFIKMLAGLIQADDDESGKKLPKLKVSYKPQKISPKFEGTVDDLLNKRIRAAYIHPQFSTDVLKPLRIKELVDQEVAHLSGGELQRVAICLVLGQPADIYLIDEPSAYLDSEQRIITAKVIKRFILHAKKTAFIVEHDFIMATYLADRVIVYEGSPSIDCTARSPESLLTGMNKFLMNLEITFRRDPVNFRPRINKFQSVKDVEQKRSGNYFYMDNNSSDDL